ncbi:MAG TPA: DUF523 domain-containing protein [Candidatus Binatia bacterium]|nr:DUF523 domain-containing protein [Candidatus Binatia bacterium]
MMRPIVVSACLVGKRCRYNGEHRAHAGVLRYLRGKKYVAVCPEKLAGWGVPRPPVEFRGGGAQKAVDGEASIVDNRGRNRTRSLMRGAKRALARALSSHATEAILKEKSPSCGVEKVFRDGRLVRGGGVFTYLLKRRGVAVRSEENFRERGAARK